VPRALQVQILDQQGYFPDEWAAPSWRLAQPLSILVGGDLPAVFRRFGGFPANEVLADPRMNEFLRKHGIQDAADRRTVAEGSGLWRRLQLGYPLAEGEKVREAVEADLSRRYLNQCINDAQSFGSAGDHARALADLLTMVKLYQWSYPLLWELAITADESGEPASALSFLESAIVLEPGNFDVWHSLSVVLKRLVRPGEAFYAAAISQYLKDPR
jgi:hypothetical protein